MLQAQIYIYTSASSFTQIIIGAVFVSGVISAKVLEHFRNPRNVGVIEDADGCSKVENPVCGDITEMYLKVSDGRIVDIKYTTLGCFATIASASPSRMLSKVSS
jgi:nitrogen fixation NifU-like protein